MKARLPAAGSVAVHVTPPAESTSSQVHSDGSAGSAQGCLGLNYSVTSEITRGFLVSEDRTDSTLLDPWYDDKLDS